MGIGKRRLWTKLAAIASFAGSNRSQTDTSMQITSLRQRLSMAVRRLARVGQQASWLNDSPQGYEAGRHSRLDAGFVPRNAGPNTLAQETLELLRARSRHLVDNNPILSGALNTHTNNIIGRGIDVRPATGNEELDRFIVKKWKSFCEGVDPARELSLRAYQKLFVTELLTSGEVLVVDSIAPARVSTRGEWKRAPAVELIEAERLEVGFSASGGTTIAGITATATVPAKNTVLQSVEVDEYGVPVAYWVRDEHPRDVVMGIVHVGSLYGSRRRVGVERARLCFDMRRPKQLRGVPWTAAAVADSRMESGFLEAALVQARIAACVGVVFEEDGDQSPLTASTENKAGGFVDSDGAPIAEISPGMVGYAKGKPSVIGSNLPAPGLEVVGRIMHNRQAAALGMSAAEVSRNYKGTTFSAARTELLSTMRGVQPLQAYVYEQSTRPLYRTFVWWLLASGQLKLSAKVRKSLGENLEQLYECMPVYPGFDWVNPNQEAAAAKTEFELGIVSRSQLCASKGRSYDDVLRQTLQEELEEKLLREKMGLPPRATVAATDANGSDPASVDNADQSQDEEQGDSQNQSDAEQDASGVTNNE